MLQQKQSDTLKSNIITTLTNFNTNNLQKFDSVFRYSKTNKKQLMILIHQYYQT